MIVSAIYAGASLCAALFLVWGLGSAGMNGIQDSSLRACFIIAVIFAAIAIVAKHFVS